MSRIPMEQNQEESLPYRGLERVCFHSLSLIDQNREYLQMHLPDADEPTGQALADIEQETARLGRVLGEMAELLTPDAERPRRRRFDLCLALRQLETMPEELWQQVGIRLVVELPQEPCMVWGVPEEAEQVCMHLLSNAFRAAQPPRGLVQLCLTQKNGEWQLTVTDNGCGLPGEENWLENHRRFLGGAGAGLLVCQTICRCSGWTLTHQSIPSGGTQALVRLSAVPPESVDPSVDLCSPGRESLPRLRLMLMRELQLGVQSGAFLQTSPKRPQKL